MGDSIMHYAAYNSLKKLLEYLLSKGCDPNACNNVTMNIKREGSLRKMWPYQRYASG